MGLIELARPGADPEENASVFQLDDSGLLRRDSFPGGVKSLLQYLRALPGEAVVVGEITSDLSIPVRLFLTRRVVFRDGGEEPSLAERDDSVIVEHVVADLRIGDDGGGLRPGDRFVRREPHHGAAVGEGILLQVKKGDLPVVKTQERDRHDIQSAFVSDDRFIHGRPGRTSVVRDPRDEIGAVVVVASAGETGVNVEESPVLQRDEVTLGVPRIAFGDA